MASFQGKHSDAQGHKVSGLNEIPAQKLEKDSHPAAHFRSDSELASKAVDQHSSAITSSTKHLEQLSLKDLREVTPDPTQSTARVQKRRLSLFEPFSLPSSRVPSLESPAPTNAPQHPSTNSTTQRLNPQTGSPMHSPPLTPASTHDRLHQRTARPAELRELGTAAPTAKSPLPPGDAAAMTPQISPPRLVSVNSATTRVTERLPLTSSAQSSRSSSPHTAQIHHPSSQAGQHHRPNFSIGPPERTPSHEGSPLGTPATTPPAGSGATTPTWFPQSRPFTPAGELDDPYARSKRPPQSKNPNDIEARFIFSKAGTDMRGDKHGGRHSHLSLHNLKKEGSSASLHSTAKHSSMSELKRFFKPSTKRSSSPAGSLRNNRTSTYSSLTAPFSDDHGLTKKYGKFGRVLGSGAGGSVRLMKRSTDGVTFAVKQFRAKHTYESEREYAKKVTAEFCIGSTLHHGNIIETLDIVHEKGKWYEVMEYCPYDLFATVMTGRMSREEVACSFMQILNGVTYLHGMGLAHRDLKLDNVVINEHGILKIIDFGSASVFKYPFENDIVEACGIVGSDPYLAPEVCNDIKYDPQPADVWSLAIIFCCMSLRRFPWKAPRQSEKSFKLFSARPDPVETPASPIANSNTLPTSRAHQQRPTTAMASVVGPANPTGNSASAPTSRVPSGNNPEYDHDHMSGSGTPHPTIGRDGEIKGPFRLLRLLPRESRHVIGRMLEIDPKKRATLDEIWQDEWIKSVQMCSQEEDGKVIRVANHQHTLEAQSGGSAASSRKSTK